MSGRNRNTGTTGEMPAIQPQQPQPLFPDSETATTVLTPLFKGHQEAGEKALEYEAKVAALDAEIDELRRQAEAKMQKRQQEDRVARTARRAEAGFADGIATLGGQAPPRAVALPQGVQVYPPANEQQAGDQQMQPLEAEIAQARAARGAQPYTPEPDEAAEQAKANRLMAAPSSPVEPNSVWDPVEYPTSVQQGRSQSQAAS